MIKCTKKKHTKEEADTMISNSQFPLEKYFCSSCKGYHTEKCLQRRPDKLRNETQAKYLEIVQLYSEGLKSDEIAKKLFISLSVIRSAFVVLCSKFEASNRTHLTAILLRKKLIQ